MIRSFLKITAVDPGFRRENLLTMRVALPSSGYPDRRSIVIFFQRLPERLRAIPGVEDVSAVNALPISGGDSMGNLTIEGRPFPPGAAPPASYRRVLPNYFRTMGIPVLKGREFDERDGAGPNGVVIINEEMARRYWLGESPIGARIKVGPPESEPWLTVVGVVGDVLNVGLDAGPMLATYEPHAQRPWSTMQIVARTHVDAASLAAPFRESLRSIERDLLIDRVATMEERISISLSDRKFQMGLLGAFAALAVLLAGIGSYGVLTCLVSQRTREIGIRMALGAKARDVLLLVLAQAMKLAVAGILLGLMAALFLTRLMERLLYDVSATDPVTMIAVAALLLGICLLAVALPAVRASRIDPMRALRYE